MLSGSNISPSTVDKSVVLPYYDVDFTSSFLEVYNNQTSVPQSFIQIAQLQIKGAIWCNNIGCSMKPEINSGNKILLIEIEDWQNCLIMNEIYAIVTTNGLRTIKRIKRGNDKDSLNLVPSNQEFEAQQIKKNTIRNMYKVIATIKAFVLTALVLLTSISIYAQRDYPKNANGVILNTEFSDVKQAMTEFKKVMVLNNVIPDKEDIDAMYMTSKKYTGDSGYPIKFTFIFQPTDSTVYVKVTGIWNANVNLNLYNGMGTWGTNSPDMSIKYKGGLGSLYKKAFCDFMEIIKKLPTKSLSYTFDNRKGKDNAEVHRSKWDKY